MAKQPRAGNEAKSPIYKRLWFAIAVAVAAGLLTLTFIGWLWGEGRIFSLRRIFSFWLLDLHAIDKAEYIKSALALVGGIGGVVYLVVKYRERAAAERDEARADRKEAEERLLAAVQQLGSESPQVRIAGVYALADVADTYLGDYKQRVVNILCGYLRTERRKLAEKRVQKGKSSGAGASEVYRPQLPHTFEDAAVESTVLQVMSGHLRRPTNPSLPSALKPEQAWNHCEFDFHSTHFAEPIPFNDCTFEEYVNFKGCRFESDAYFAASTFKAVAEFDRSTFNGRTLFVDSTFNGRASFDRSTFNGAVGFDGSSFDGSTSFDGSIFNGEVGFDGSTFNGSTGFDGSIFNGEVGFDGSTFNYGTSYVSCAFNVLASYATITFNRGARFDHSIFKGLANFGDSIFGGWASFAHSTFEGTVAFDGSTFNVPANFGSSTFAREAQKAHQKWFERSPFGPIPLEDNGLPKGARWDDDPAPSDDETAPEDSPPDGDTALPDGH